MKINKLSVLLLTLLFFDISYSFVQHSHAGLDGDMANIILPAEMYSEVLKDPFGFRVLTQGKEYAATNRFFAHWTMSNYFITVPIFLQPIFSPIDSVYLASALGKTLIQIGLIWLLAVYITGKKILNSSFLIAAVLVMPLFQTAGYHNTMGIIDQSATYTFFYILPLSFLLYFFLPFYEAWRRDRKLNLTVLQKTILLFLAIILPFSGPLVPAIVLIICPSVLLYKFWSNIASGLFFSFRRIPNPLLFYFLLISILSLYSMYIGTNNTENSQQSMFIGERYLRLTKGLFSLFSSKLGLPLLTFAIGLNIFLINRQKTPEAQKIMQAFKWMGVLSIVYLLLLPLGGYREYRPNIVRKDTLIPVVIGMMYLFGLSAHYLIHHIRPKLKNKYLSFLAIVLLIFIIVDTPNFDQNACEKAALEKIAKSTENIVPIESDCNIMAWHKLTFPEASETNARLLLEWRIVREKKQYFQRLDD